MRFYADGPTIPDKLLNRRDEGRVVFLCGAGVSINAGMPTFVDLTKYVLENLRPSEDSDLARSFRQWDEGDYDGRKTPLDQIFNLLYQEFSQAEVSDLVTERLRLNSLDEDSEEHGIIARISTDSNGKPQIVTTNFDHLFERTSKNTGTIHVPPALPNLDLGVSISGITYLHGRLPDGNENSYPYVLSSADFGRAYLAEGWATEFVRNLLDLYTVVLVGYQAEDPPVNYLLQGLNEDRKPEHSNLYAFDRGMSGEVEAKWRNKGVVGIGYEDHEDLWNTLKAWAERTDNLDVWGNRVLELARKDPKGLKRHERGQVVHLARTTSGAKLFASAEQPPSAEWLCVFDRNFRTYQESERSIIYKNGRRKIDFLDIYGLDDDPPRDDRDSKYYDNVLEWREGDSNKPTAHRITESLVHASDGLPQRLDSLIQWIGTQLNSPTTVWWAFRQKGLHPKLLDVIRRAIDSRSTLCSEARRWWCVIWDYHTSAQIYPIYVDWYSLVRMIGREGWNRKTLRYFEAVTKPKYTITPPFGDYKLQPPREEWQEIKPEQLARFDVTLVARGDEGLPLPEDMLEEVFCIIEKQLLLASELWGNINKTHFLTPSCYPDREVDGSTWDSEDDFFCWYLELFNRMVEMNPLRARAHAVLWPIDDEYYFRKLKLFALNQKALFDAEEVVEIILSMCYESFWDLTCRRELIFLISDRWTEFSQPNREFLVDRLLCGPMQMDYWAGDEYPTKRDEMAVIYVKVLMSKGISLTNDQSITLNEMVDRVGDYSVTSDVDITTEHSVRSGMVQVDESSTTLSSLSIDRIIEQAAQDTRLDWETVTRHYPFLGLVKSEPEKALAALSHEAEKREYPVERWRELFEAWPDDVDPCLYRELLCSLKDLPVEIVTEIRHKVGDWLKKYFSIAFQLDKQLAWSIFDKLLPGLSVDPGSIFEPSKTDDANSGVERPPIPRTYEVAINSPIGKATQGCLRALSTLELESDSGIPEEFETGIERLLNVHHSGQAHAVAILTSKLGYLYYLDPDWVVRRALPWFDDNNSLYRPAVNGYLLAGCHSLGEIGEQLNKVHLQLFPKIYDWGWDVEVIRLAAQMVVDIGVLSLKDDSDLRDEDIRECLRNMNDDSRQQAVVWLQKIGLEHDNGWSNHVIPFIERMWPRESRFKTSSLTIRWVDLLRKTKNHYPELLNVVRRFLVRVDSDRYLLAQFARDLNQRDTLLDKHPTEVLETVDAVISARSNTMPNELQLVLEKIRESDSNLVGTKQFARLSELVKQEKN